jgi:hypothetical protein
VSNDLSFISFVFFFYYSILMEWDILQDLTDSFADIPLDDRPTIARLRRQKKLNRVTLADFPKEWLPDRPSKAAEKEEK